MELNIGYFHYLQIPLEDLLIKFFSKFVSSGEISKIVLTILQFTQLGENALMDKTVKEAYKFLENIASKYLEEKVNSPLSIYVISH